MTGNFINTNQVLPNQDVITISKREYDQLLDDSLKLNCFEMMGVDNWVGYDEAMNLYRDGGLGDD